MKYIVLFLLLSLCLTCSVQATEPAKLAIKNFENSECYKYFYANNFERAFSHCKKASQKDIPYGKYIYGVMLARGLATEVKLKEGAALVAEAAHEGISDAQRDLGSSYQNGWGNEVDIDKAIYWYKKSAVQNNVIAHQYLSLIYLRGLGVPKDLPLGYAYLILAVNGGNEKAVAVMEILKSIPEITPEVIEKADIISKKLSSELVL